MEKEQTHLSSTASQPPLLDAPQTEKAHNLKRCCWAISSARLKMQAALCRREWCLCRRAKKRTRKKGEVKAKAHRKVTTRKTSCYVSSGWPRTLVTCDGNLFFFFSFLSTSSSQLQLQQRQRLLLREQQRCLLLFFAFL